MYYLEVCSQVNSGNQFSTVDLNLRRARTSSLHHGWWWWCWWWLSLSSWSVWPIHSPVVAPPSLMSWWWWWWWWWMILRLSKLNICWGWWLVLKEENETGKGSDLSAAGWCGGSGGGGGGEAMKRWICSGTPPSNIFFYSYSSFFVHIEISLFTLFFSLSFYIAIFFVILRARPYIYLKIKYLWLVFNH